MNRTERLLWALGGALLALLLTWTPLFDRVDRAWLDLSLRLQAAAKQAQDTVVVDIDAASLHALRARWGDWPLPRELHAAVAERLLAAGAHAVVFNLLFDDAQPGNDALRAVAERSGRIVYGAAPLPTFDGVARAAPALIGWPAAVDVPALATASVLTPDLTLLPSAALAHVGVMSAPVDTDGLLRCVPLLLRIQSMRGQMLPSLPLAALGVTDGREPPPIAIDGDGLQIGPHRWPTNAQGCVALRLPANADAVPALRFAAFVDTAADPELDERVRGRTVFVGSPSQMDVQVMTPRGHLGATQWQAIAHEGLRAGWWIAPAPLAASIGMLALALVPAALGVWRRTPSLGRDALDAAVVAVLVTAVGWLLLRYASLVAPVTAAVHVVLVGAAAGGGRWLVWQSRERARARRAQLEAEAASRAKTEFLAHMSHEIRTPLNALVGMGQLLAETPLTPQQRDYVDVFISGGKHLQHLIDDTLDLSRIEAGRLPLSSEVFALSALVDEISALFASRAQAAGLGFIVEAAEALPRHVQGDAHRLRQMLLNVLGNAFKFTRKGSITLKVRPTGEADTIEFQVVDTGIGVDETQLTKIFEPFAQADERITREFGGSGLGLAITRRLAQSMGGDIDMTSEPGHGSTVTLRLPLPARAEPSLDERAVDVVEAAAPSNSSWAGRRVLLAEDNRNNVLVVQGMLAATGLAIDVVADGRAAVDAATGTAYDAVLMDIQMPLLDGHAATRDIRRAEHEAGRQPVPILALSANALSSDAQASLDAGCNRHLAKPLDKTALLAALARFLNAGTAPVSAPAAATDDAFDSASAIQRLGGDRALYERVRAAAVEHLDDWPASFDAAVASGDAVLCRRLAHDLKSTAGTVGAGPLQRAAGVLEERVRSVDGAVFDGGSTPISEARAAVQRALDAVRPRLSGDATVPPPPPSAPARTAARD